MHDATFLSMLDNYIKVNGIPQNEFEISRSYFPEYLIDGMKRELSKTANVDDLDNNIQFFYDDNANLIMMATANNGKTRLYLNDEGKEVKTPLPGLKMYFERLLLKSCAQRELSNVEIKVNNILKNNLPNESIASINRISYAVMNSFISKYNEVLAEHNDDVIDKTNANLDLYNTALKITEYLKYLKESLFEQKEIVTVIYNPPLPEKNNIDRQEINGVTNERKNDILPLENRMEILAKYSPKYICNGQNGVTGEKDFLSYLYQANENEYYLILEPTGGNRRTMLIGIRSENEIDFDTFVDLTLKNLELSNSESMNSSNIARLNHTTLDAFGKSIDYIFTRDGKKNNINQYTKDNIDTINFVDVDVKVL